MHVIFMQALRGDKRRRPPQHFRLALRYIHEMYSSNTPYITFS